MLREYYLLLFSNCWAGQSPLISSLQLQIAKAYDNHKFKALQVHKWLVSKCFHIWPTSCITKLVNRWGTSNNACWATTLFSIVGCLCIPLWMCVIPNNLIILWSSTIVIESMWSITSLRLRRAQLSGFKLSTHSTHVLHSRRTSNNACKQRRNTSIPTLPSQHHCS